MAQLFSHKISIEVPISDALFLFTPKGEEDWVPDWKPVYIRPATGETCEEMLFTTGEGEEKTFWTCLLWKPENHQVRYLRLTPASRVVFVDVKCEAEGDLHTVVTVEYDIEPLNDAGQEFVSGMSSRSFAQSIDAWRDLIHAYRSKT